MSEDREREEIARWFRELRQSEERGARSFDEVLAGARPRRVYYRLAAAAALVVLLAIPSVWWQKSRHAQEVEVGPMASISQWKSPTDFLVETPGQEMLKTVPRIGDGFMDMGALHPKEKR